jgi:hypothetical protein
MTKTLQLLGLAALLATGTATATLAANDDSGGSKGSQSVTGSKLGSQQTNVPATDSTIKTPSGQRTTGTAGPPNYNANPQANTTGRSAQTTGSTYPGVVGPTRSTQPDATNPVRSSPSGGGGMDHGGGAGAGSR